MTRGIYFGVLAAMCGLCHAALMPIEWIADGDENAPKIITIAQGETRDLVPTLRNYGAAVVIPDTATATLRYQTNGMGRSWWSGHTATVTTGGVVTATWTPDLDCGAPTYTFAIGVKDGSNLLYTAYGLIRMRTSPGWVPNELSLPRQSLDFATLDVLNAPWPDMETISNLVAAVEGGIGTIVEEVDPIALPVAQAALEAAATKVPLVEGTGEASEFKAGGGFSMGGESWLTPNGLILGKDNILYGERIIIDNEGILQPGNFRLKWPTVNNYFEGAPIATEADIAAATNAAISSIFSLKNALLIVSNEVATITTNGVPIWSSTSGGGSLPAITNELWQSISALQSTVSSLQASLAGISRDWGSFAPDGSANPDPDYMLYINRPATVWASGFQWATSGGHAVLSTTGTVAFAVGDSGEMRIGPGDGTNYFGFVQGGSVEIGARAAGITVVGEVATILYPYAAGDFPTLWFTADLAIPFEPISGVVWVDNADGTATVTAPATTEKGFWRATTSATYKAEFRSTMPARFTGGVFGATNAVPVIYDSTIQITSGGKNYRIPAEEL